MAKDPAFLFYPGDYLRDTQCLSEKAQVAYDRIMCEHMRNICISKKQLVFFTKRLSDDEKDELMMILTEADGNYQICWVVESIEKRKRYSESRRNNRISKPKEKTKNTSLSYDSHMENENVIVNDIVIKDYNEVKVNEEFEYFWDEYDKKVGDKQKIRKKFIQLSQKDRSEILRTMAEYVHSTPDKSYRKNPQTYLNARGWEDEIITKHPEKNEANRKQPRNDDKKVDWLNRAIDRTGQ